MTIARSGQFDSALRVFACNSAGISPLISTVALPISSLPNTSGAAIAHIWWPWHASSITETLMLYRLINVNQADRIGKLGFRQQMCLVRNVCAPIVRAFHPSIQSSPLPLHRWPCSLFLALPCCTSLTAVFPMAEVLRFLRLLVSRLAISFMLLLPRQGSLRSSLPRRLPSRQSNGLVRAI